MADSGKAVIALLTDFGTRDPYVAAMKAVIASRCDASILDLTHDIPPFDVFEAAWFVAGVSDYLANRRFIVVAVVDPGVGSGRKILAMERGGQLFLAPDNGLLTLVASEHSRFYSVENAELFLPHGSNTFHGRDRFAPVAAALASGVAVEMVGPEVAPAEIVRLDYAPPHHADGALRGRVVSIDRYGNAITDIPAAALNDAALITVAGRQVSALARNYEEGRKIGGAFAIAGSRGTVEISVSAGRAADLLQIARFDPVEIHQRK